MPTTRSQTRAKSRTNLRNRSCSVKGKALKKGKSGLHVCKRTGTKTHDDGPLAVRSRPGGTARVTELQHHRWSLIPH